jgi:hypothetical protein
MAPFAGAGVVDMAKLAAYVLQMGFGVKNPDEFMVQQQPMPQGMPAGMPQGMPNPQQAGAMPETGGPEMGMPFTGNPAELQAFLGEQGMIPPA